LLIFPLLPLMNLSVFFNGEIAHDRYLYTPSIGFALLVAIGLMNVEHVRLPKWLSQCWREYGLKAAIALIAIVFLGLTIWQSLYWADNLVLYNRGVWAAPDNNLAVNNLANEFERRKMYPQAITLYTRVLQRNPNFYLSNYNLGYVSYEAGQYEQAVRFLRRAAVLDPTDAGTFYYLAKCEMQLGELDNAEANLHRAIATDPRLLGPRYTLGLLYKQEGKTKEALDYFRAELVKNPNDADARREVEQLSGK
ncbi:MAG TPA: tetratricopeptide repeat protein, partial [Terriglobales bacterium]|nr:tetratricopeptide repeat protein [Terriglobales bacterium]